MYLSTEVLNFMGTPIYNLDCIVYIYICACAAHGLRHSVYDESTATPIPYYLRNGESEMFCDLSGGNLTCFYDDNLLIFNNLCENFVLASQYSHPWHQ